MKKTIVIANWKMNLKPADSLQLAEEVARLVPDFSCTYEPDSRQKIADSWPKSIDDSQARRDWGWASKYDLRKMSEDMVSNLRLKLLGK